MEGIEIGLVITALLSVGLVQACIGLAKPFGLSGRWINLYAIVVGAGLAALAKYVFPDPLAAITYAQIAVFGGLNGFATTGLWEFRRGDSLLPAITQVYETRLDPGSVGQALKDEARLGRITR